MAVLCVAHIPIMGLLFFFDVHFLKKMKDKQFEQYFIKLQERKKSIQIAKIRNGVSYDDCDDIIMPDEKIKMPIIYYSVLVLACVLGMGMTI